MKSKKKDVRNKSGLLARNKSKIYILLLILIPFILYFRVVSFEFSTLDDTDIISNNINIIRDLGNISIAFTTDGYLTNKISFYRPLQTLTYMNDAQISGEEAWGYHLSNIILHLLCVVVLFIFLKQTGIKEDLAFLLSLLFSAHPLLTHAVCWIPARGDLLLTLLGLLSFVAFINYFRTPDTKYIVYHSICFLLLGFAKETAIVFPLLFIMYFYLILEKSTPFKKLVPFLIIWICSFIIYFVFRESAIKVSDPSSIAGIVPFIKNLPAIPIIFGKIFIPQGLTTMPLFNLLSILIGIIFFILFVILLIKEGISRNPYVIFGAIWFICFILPPMFFRLPLAEHEAEYFEHRTGLPVIGIFIMLGILLNTISIKIAYKKILNLSLVVIILFAFIAWSHSSDYSDPLAFFTSAINSNSNNAVALNTRAGVYFANGNMDQAAHDLDNAIKVYPIYSSPYHNKGNLYKRLKDQNQAAYFYSLAINYDTLYPGINPNRTDVYISLSVIKLNQNMNFEALALLKKAIAIDSSDSKIFKIMGAIYFNKAEYDSAIKVYSRAIELEPKSYSIYYTRARAKYSIKDYIGALNDLNKAVELNPDYPDAYFYRGKTYSILNKPAESKENFEKALSLGYKEDQGQTKQ
jgi:protein O-mannosyl-transferase